MVNLAENTEEAKDAGEVKDIEVVEGDEDAVDAEVVEGGEEVEWDDSHADAAVEVLDVRSEITGPHDPESITGKRRGAKCMAKDRQ